MDGNDKGETCENGAFRMEARFISNVDPDDAAGVLCETDAAHAIFVLVFMTELTTFILCILLESI